MMLLVLSSVHFSAQCDARSDMPGFCESPFDCRDSSAEIRTQEGHSGSFLSPLWTFSISTNICGISALLWLEELLISLSLVMIGQGNPFPVWREEPRFVFAPQT